MDENPSTFSLTKQARAGLPLTVPWIKRHVQLGAAFDSSQLTTESGPWMSHSALDVAASSLVYDGEVEGKAAFRDAESDSISSGTEHFSGSLGVTVGCPFLKANITGSYDKTVMEIKNVSQHVVSCLKDYPLQECFFRAKKYPGQLFFEQDQFASGKSHRSLQRPEFYFRDQMATVRFVPFLGIITLVDTYSAEMQGHTFQLISPRRLR